MSGDAPDERGYSGRAVLVLLLVASVLTVVLALTIIRPKPGATPEPVNRRAFGPATADDARDRPLIEKRNTSRTVPADGDPGGD